jgi:hypothetical protein
LGDEPDGVIAAITTALGPPAADSDWGPHPIVDGAEYRWARWGESLFLWFGDDATPYGADGTAHFQGYEYFGSPGGLATVEGIGVGSLVGDLLAAYGAEADLVLNELTQQDYRYQINPPGTDYFLCFEVGAEMPDESTQISGIWAGRDCTYGGE